MWSTLVFQISSRLEYWEHIEKQSGYTNTTELEYHLRVLTETVSLHILMHAVPENVYKVEKENRKYFDNH